MTLTQLLIRARKLLAAGGMEDASLEGELLLRHALGMNRVQLYQELNSEMTRQQEETFWNLVRRRLSGEPTAYITGHCEFYGLDFYVDRRVLIPRPETELLVEKVLRLAQDNTISTIADIGTGCGAIAVTLALHLPRAVIYATDLSATALEVAALNCRKHGVADRIRLLKGNLLDPVSEPVDLIIANLPYVRKSYLTQMSTAGFEPSLALDGGVDGLDRIRQLCHQASREFLFGGYLILEIGEGQSQAVASLLRHLFSTAEIAVTPDIGGIDRMVCLSLTTAGVAI